MGMEILSPGGHLGVEIGNAVQDRHGGGPDRVVFLFLPPGQMGGKHLGGLPRPPRDIAGNNLGNAAPPRAIEDGQRSSHALHEG
ncbi:hypothetical protein GCM10011504_28050 [Siccirubricoccus deserti]|nr:hypothetical protein GCM10011504_28050 [Siccirubricoccus deserti]